VDGASGDEEAVDAGAVLEGGPEAEADNNEEVEADGEDVPGVDGGRNDGHDFALISLSFLFKSFLLQKAN